MTTHLRKHLLSPSFFEPCHHWQTSLVYLLSSAFCWVFTLWHSPHSPKEHSGWCSTASIYIATGPCCCQRTFGSFQLGVLTHNAAWEHHYTYGLLPLGYYRWPFSACDRNLTERKKMAKKFPDESEHRPFVKWYSSRIESVAKKMVCTEPLKKSFNWFFFFLRDATTHYLQRQTWRGSSNPAGCF